MVVSAVSGVLAVKLFFDDDGSLRGVNMLLLIPSRDHEGVPNAIRSENLIGKYQENWISALLFCSYIAVLKKI